MKEHNKKTLDKHLFPSVVQQIVRLHFVTSATTTTTSFLKFAALRAYIGSEKENNTHLNVKKKLNAPTPKTQNKILKNYSEAVDFIIMQVQSFILVPLIKKYA